MPAVFDSESLERQFKETELERQRQIQADEISRILAEAYYIKKGDFTNQERQAGRKLAEDDFEKRVIKLNPNLAFKQRPLSDHECDFVETKRGAWLKTLMWKQPKDLVAIASYEKRAMLNEFDIVLMRAKVIGTIHVDRYSKHNMITDLPKYKVERNFDGTPNVIFEGLNNLQQQTYEPCGRIIGWRSTLARAIAIEALELEAVEREFDPADRATWAQKTGKQALTVEI